MLCSSTDCQQLMQHQLLMQQQVLMQAFQHATLMPMPAGHSSDLLSYS
jgi:hypothetical protein